jgi:UDP-3-O-acyl-N-acetylglucosamine deacetylase
LVYQGTTVEMIEHVMAALYGMGIDNCIVECDACEMPAMDGSAIEMAIAIDQAGTRLQGMRAREICIDSLLRVGDDRSGVEAIPAAGMHASGLELRYHLDFGPKSVIPSSTSSYVLTPSEFLVNIAPARTFLSEHDAKELQRMGVAQHVTYRDLIVFGNDGPIDNTLRFPDECSRHKLLDLIGDLALCGARVRGTIIARRSGHNLNGRMAEHLLNLHLAEQHPLSHVA